MVVAEIQTPAPVPLAEINPFTIPMQEEVNPFTVNYSPDQQATSLPSTQVPLAYVQNTAKNIFALLFAPATTGVESKLKGKIYGITCLASILRLAGIWFAFFSERLADVQADIHDTTRKESWTNESTASSLIVVSIPLALVTLVSFWFWAQESTNQEKTCPKCGSVPDLLM